MTHVKDHIVNERDIIISALFVLIIYILQWQGTLKEFSISVDAFLQSYVTIIAIVLAVFTIFSLYEKIITSINRKGYFHLIQRHFYTPILTAAIGIFVSIFYNVFTFNYIASLNIFFFTYSVLSMVETFNFIFNLIFEMRK